VFQVTPPSEPGRFYPDSYHAPPAAFENLVGAEGWKVELVREWAPGPRLVEVGPGMGAFAVAAARAALSVSTIEADPEAVERLQSAHGISSICSSEPHEALPRDATLDAVVGWHVVEHLPDPCALLEAAAESLVVGGALFLAAPNPGALGFRMLGARWPHVDAPRHVQLLPSRLLVERAGAHGLQAVSCTTDDEGARHWNAFSWRRALSPAGSGITRRAIARGAGPVLTFLAAPLERRPGQGSAYTLVLRRM